MRKSLIAIIAIFFGQYSLSQNKNNIESGYFLKTIEYNIVMKGRTESDNQYNLKNKSTIDRVFFGETNSPIEFVIQTSFNGASGLRIIKDSSDNIHRIEIMNMPNSDKILNILSREEKELIIPYELEKSTTLDKLKQINEYNKKVLKSKQNGEIYKPYKTKSKSFIISKIFAEKLHDKMASLINNFKVEGIPSLISDGDNITFRCVVGNELWTLTIHSPQRESRQLSDLCKQIIADSKSHQLDEHTYLNLLDKIN